MDNLTHTLAGIVVGDAAIALSARSGVGKLSRPGVRQAAVLTSILANNAPDLDFVYAGITEGKLGYLLHHRGHTHTLLAALPLTLLCVGLVALAVRLRGVRLGSSGYGALAGLAAFGSVLHVLMDFGNNYGVHPFWPFFNGWYYGDAIFIIEPWLMIILGGMAFGARASIAARVALSCCMAALLYVAWTSALSGPLLASLLSAFTLLWLAWMWWAAPRWRWRSGALALSLLWLSLLATRQEARASVRAALEGDAALTLVSLSSTPAPGNPLCWWVLAVQHSEDRYVVRQALASGWPGVYGVERCSWLSDASTAPLQAPRGADAMASDSRLEWGPEFRAPLRELLQTRERDCVAAAFLRFARVPFWLRDGERVSLIGDLRYDRSLSIDFAELELEPNAPCPRNEPPWEPPLPLLAE